MSLDKLGQLLLRQDFPGMRYMTVSHKNGCPALKTGLEVDCTCGFDLQFAVVTKAEFEHFVARNANPDPLKHSDGAA